MTKQERLISDAARATELFSEDELEEFAKEQVNYYIYQIPVNDASVVKFIASAPTKEEAVERAERRLQQWREVGRTPLRYEICYNPSNTLVAEVKP